MTHTVSDNLRSIGESIATMRRVDEVYYYPGMHGDVLASAIKPDVRASLNERNAFEFAYGASLVGADSLVICKGVGIATFLDSLNHAVINGVSGGLVIVVLEDTVAMSSPEIVDSRVLNDYCHTLIIEPSTLANAVEAISHGFAVSQQLDIPVLVRLTHQLLTKEFVDRTSGSTLPTGTLSSPGHMTLRAKTIGPWSEKIIGYEKKQECIRQFVDSCYPHYAGSEFTFGAVSRAENNASAVIEYYPIASSIHAAFSAHQDKTVSEIGSNYAERTLFSGQSPTVDSRHIHEMIAPVMHDWDDALCVVDKSHYALVVGDEGKFTADPFGLIDTCLCMGSSVAIAAGAALFTGTRTLAITGDFSYLFHGVTATMEAQARGAILDIMLLDDGKASSTGGQRSIVDISSDTLGRLASSIEEYDYGHIPAEFVGQQTGITIRRIKK